MSDRDAAGINSQHNACTFREDCQAEALLAERDAEIARLRKILGWVAQNPEERAYWLGSVTALELDVKDAEIARLRDALTSKGFVECGIPACNCGSWHHRYGLPERFAEIKEVLRDADVLNNDTGNLPLNAIKKLISQRDAVARLSEDAARYRLTPAVIQCLKRGLNCWPEQNNAEGAEIREILKKAEEVKLRIGEDV